MQAVIRRVTPHTTRRAGSATTSPPRRRLSRLLVAALTVAAGLAQVYPPAARADHSGTQYTVTHAGDPTPDGCSPTHCTLREAITAANALAGKDSIHFAIDAAQAVNGIYIIRPASALPTITQPLALDATTQPGYTGSPVVEIDGTIAPAEAVGLRISAGSSLVRGFAINRFGTTGAATGGGAGIVLQTGGGNVIEGNYVGTDPTGMLHRPNRTVGLSISLSSNNVIGGTTPAARNVITANDDDGILINGQSGVATNNRIIGNYIGVGADGSAALGNQFDGIHISQAAINFVGGTTPAERNIISGNGAAGVHVAGLGAQRNVISGNYIGTDASGTLNRRNFRGVFFTSKAWDNTVGGTAPGAGNVIAFNSETGVLVPDTGLDRSIRIRIQGNSIHSNGITNLVGLGIDLTPEGGPTPNDLGDADLGGNRLMNFPVLGEPASAGSTPQVSGRLNSEASKTFRLEFFASPACDASGHGEGQLYIGSHTVTTDGSGNAVFNFTGAVPVTPGWFISATSMEQQFGNTSEFSECVPTIVDPEASFAVIKGAVGGDVADEWTFDVQGGPFASCFGQTDFSVARDESFGCVGDPGQIVTVHEIDPGVNYDFSEIDCAGAGNVEIDRANRTVTITLVADTRTTCSFLNTFREEPAPTVTLVKSASPSALPEPGGVFTFAVAITNTSEEPVTITDLTDTNELSEECLALIGTSLAPAGEIGDGAGCTYEVVHTDAGVYENTAEVIVADADGNTGAAADDEAVIVSDEDPQAGISKTADPTELPEPGGLFTYALTITNSSVESVTITDLSDDYDLSQGCLDLVGTTLAAGANVGCEYAVQHTAIGEYSNTAEVIVTDNEGNVDTAAADETVEVTGVDPTVSIGKVASPGERPEPGGDFTFDLTVTNTSNESVTITSLTDRYPLSPECTALVGAVLSPAGTVSDQVACTYTVNHTVPGVYVNTARVDVVDDDDAVAFNTDDEAVRVTDILPEVGADKTASPTAVNAPGATVQFTVEVRNVSDSGEAVTLRALADNRFGDLLDDPGNSLISNATCTGGTVIAVGTPYRCAFDATVSGTGGTQHVNTVTATAEDDELNEASDTGTAIVDIIAPPTLSIADIQVIEGDDGLTDALFRVRLSRAIAQPVTVDWTTVDQTGVAQEDYIAGSGRVTFAAGTTEQFIVVRVIGDLVHEPTETYRVLLSDPSGAQVADGEGIGTILDDDPLPTLAIDDVTVIEGNSGTKDAVFTVTIDGESSTSVSTQWATANGTAQAGSDYVGPRSGQLQWGSGDASPRFVTIRVIGDTVDELTEAFFARLSSPAGVSYLDSEGIGTIVDNERAVVLIKEDVSVQEGNAAVFTVQLTRPSNRRVSVELFTANVTATAGDYTSVTRTISWNPGRNEDQTVSVATTADAIDEPRESYRVALRNVQNAQIDPNRGSALGYIKDCSVLGTAGDDVLRGGTGDDVICGLGGNDRLYGGAGKDELRGGAGNDRLRGNAGMDAMDGGTGSDTVSYVGHQFAVTLNLGDAVRVDGQTIPGRKATGDGNDTLLNIENAEGGAKGDILVGSVGSNMLEGGDGIDKIFGMDGNDGPLSGGDGNDEIYGGNGNDSMVGGRGYDLMDGGPGSDACFNGEDQFGNPLPGTDTVRNCEAT